MADTGTAPAPMTAEERARRCLGALGIIGDHERVTTIVATIAAHICAAETKAEQRGAERAATIVDLEVAAAHGRGDSRMASELIRCAGAIRARGKQKEPA